MTAHAGMPITIRAGRHLPLPLMHLTRRRLEYALGRFSSRVRSGLEYHPAFREHTTRFDYKSGLKVALIRGVTRVVDQDNASWNRLTSWLRKIEALRIVV